MPSRTRSVSSVPAAPSAVLSHGRCPHAIRRVATVNPGCSSACGNIDELGSSNEALHIAFIALE